MSQVAMAHWFVGSGSMQSDAILQAIVPLGHMVPPMPEEVVDEVVMLELVVDMAPPLPPAPPPVPIMLRSTEATSSQPAALAASEPATMANAVRNVNLLVIAKLLSGLHFKAARSGSKNYEHRSG
jgi:hypothetical protein